jgi:hypothetical protein
LTQRKTALRVLSRHDDASRIAPSELLERGAAANVTDNAHVGLIIVNQIDVILCQRLPEVLDLPSSAIVGRR